MNIEDSIFKNCSTILDVGGWFKPEPRATHVVDLMPWETRGAKLNLEKLAYEHFSKETWFQVDFLRKDFHLPYTNKAFDLVICGQTIEDLTDPTRLLQEMGRVGKGGFIECPSRACEQTIGILDRKGAIPGYPHHHWIVEADGQFLNLYSKEDSDLTFPGRHIPLEFFEKCKSRGLISDIVIYEWVDTPRFSIVRGTDCSIRAEKFVTRLDIPCSTRLLDNILRFARRSRDKLYNKSHEDAALWWARIVKESQPYSKINLM